MRSEQFCQLIIDLIDEINVCRETQNCVDEKYTDFVKIVHDEMNEKLTPLSKGGRRKCTPYKPYWTDELSRLWKLAHDKENIYCLKVYGMSISTTHCKTETTTELVQKPHLDNIFCRFMDILEHIFNCYMVGVSRSAVKNTIVTLTIVRKRNNLTTSGTLLDELPSMTTIAYSNKRQLCYAT